MKLLLKLLLLPISTLLLFSRAQAERLIGQDYLGAQHPRMQIVNSSVFIREGSPLGTLDWTFGTGTKKLEDWVTKVKPKYWRIHLLNGPCVRGGNCGKYEPVYGYTMGSLDAAIRSGDRKLTEHVKTRAKLYRDISKRHLETKFLLSPILEHNLSDSAWRALADTVKRVWPEVQLVNSPMTFPAERYKRAWLESHGQDGNTNVEINSLDGHSASDIDIEKWKERFPDVKILFTHDRIYNGRLASGAWIDPRVRKAFPLTFQFEELAHITDKRRNPPDGFPDSCKIREAFLAPNIWKQFAENKNNGDVRANYPVSITDFNGTNVSIIAANGTSIGSLGYYGVYQNGLNRHYSAWTGGSHLNGYTFEKLAKEEADTPWTYLKQGSRCKGPLLTGMRQGVMR